MLVREMPRYVRCGFISNEDLSRGRWQGPLDRLMQESVPEAVPDVTGADAVAEAILAAAAWRAT
jgi:hypothetical protein